jgi:hypothetical protein
MQEKRCSEEAVLGVGQLRGDIAINDSSISWHSRDYKGFDHKYDILKVVGVDIHVDASKLY